MWIVHLLFLAALVAATATANPLVDFQIDPPDANHVVAIRVTTPVYSHLGMRAFLMVGDDAADLGAPELCSCSNARVEWMSLRDDDAGAIQPLGADTPPSDCDADVAGMPPLDPAQAPFGRRLVSALLDASDGDSPRVTYVVRYHLRSLLEDCGHRGVQRELVYGADGSTVASIRYSFALSFVVLGMTPATQWRRHVVVHVEPGTAGGSSSAVAEQCSLYRASLSVGAPRHPSGGGGGGGVRLSLRLVYSGVPHALSVGPAVSVSADNGDFVVDADTLWLNGSARFLNVTAPADSVHFCTGTECVYTIEVETDSDSDIFELHVSPHLCGRSADRLDCRAPQSCSDRSVDVFVVTVGGGSGGGGGNGDPALVALTTHTPQLGPNLVAEVDAWRQRVAGNGPAAGAAAGAADPEIDLCYVLAASNSLDAAWEDTPVAIDPDNLEIVYGDAPDTRLSKASLADREAPLRWVDLLALMRLAPRDAATDKQPAMYVVTRTRGGIDGLCFNSIDVLRFFHRAFPAQIPRHAASQWITIGHRRAAATTEAMATATDTGTSTGSSDGSTGQPVAPNHPHAATSRRLLQTTTTTVVQTSSVVVATYQVSTVYDYGLCAGYYVCSGVWGDYESVNTWVYDAHDRSRHARERDNDGGAVWLYVFFPLLTVFLVLLCIMYAEAAAQADADFKRKTKVGARQV